MLAPVMKEEIVCSVEVMETFKITKVGTVAGCLVREGKITRNTNIRVIRDGIVVYTGKLGSLKRFKDDVKEVTTRSGMRSEHRELQRCPRGRHYRGLRAGRGEAQVDARSERYLSVTVIPPAFVRKPAEFFPVSSERLSRLHSQGAGKRSADFLREAGRGLCCGYRTP